MCWHGFADTWPVLLSEEDRMWMFPGQSRPLYLKGNNSTWSTYWVNLSITKIICYCLMVINFSVTKLFFTLWQDLCSNTTLLLQKDFTCDIFSVNFLKFSQVPVRSHSISWTAVVADHRLRLQVPPQSPLCHSTLTVSPISWLCMFVLVMQFQDPNHISFFATLITKDVVAHVFI